MFDIPAAKVCFTGDTLFNEGCSICEGPGANPEQIFESVQKLIRLVSADTLVFPGHSFGTPAGKTFQFLKDNNIYMNFTKREQFVIFG